ncbi:hypothetical protein HCN44_006232 [Aphidius gifuensis]|uniref:Large ribosomal subunit protein mL39 n=1 Tax=Aphidius gifuensis TaxID=684658 RepID=A0A834XX17_APHGI|nr:39S ribosomal protein L39, mitochondrial [Aphidius gifuensis]KAF7993172.1 hypothetical protein HCN44_006232 [Aphidius gifuensis]
MMIQRLKGFYSAVSKLQPQINGIRCMSSLLTKSDAQERRNEAFNNEKKRQRAAVGRIEKVTVTYQGNGEEIKLLMNKELSTPYDCARHITEGVATTSALASVNGVPWDMHRPLVSDCELKLFTMRTPDRSVNNAFWRTCSLMLGAVVDSAFKDNITCHLHSFTSPNIKSGSFLYDVYLDLPNWSPTLAEMKSLSGLFSQLCEKKLPIERLEVDTGYALDMFQDNPYKTQQIPNIAKFNENKIVLYRIGKHIDISKGPMICHTGIVGRCTINGIHKIKNDAGETLYRFQGIALPKGIILNHFIYSVLEKRSEKLNQTVWMPQRMEPESEQSISIAAKN